VIQPGVWPLADVAGMRALDRHTIEVLGVPGEILMESAGRAVADAVLRRFPETRGQHVTVLCGAGNNGGDGLVVARHLHLLGVPVRGVLLCDPAHLGGDAAANHARAVRAGVSFASADEDAGWLPERGVVVDALFGTGLARPVEGPAAHVIARLNEARSRAAGEIAVVAVDVPSGLDADTGQPLGTAVCADLTVSIGLPKLGLTLEPGRSLAGRVVVARIGIADDAPGVSLRAELWNALGVVRRLPARPADGHKGTFGHVLVVAGSEGKTGAAVLAARGAARAGAGLVTIACAAGLNDILEEKCTEAMTAPVGERQDRALLAGAEEALVALSAERDVVAMGPGVGRSRETVSLMRALAKRVERPLVIDADGLFALAGELGTLRARRSQTILTPHPGEAAALLGCRADDVNRDRVGRARELAERTGAVVLLKGAATVAAAPDGQVIVNPTGGPALASGGTGDVLVGLVAAWLAQGVAPLEAAAVAAWVHGAAADRLAEQTGAAGALASEVADRVPETVAALRTHAGGAIPEVGVGLAVPLLRG
jgi:NAD(P)H-hydrate epimerase